MSLVEVAQICSIIIAAASVLGLMGACLHFELPEKFKTLIICGRECITIQRTESKKLDDV